MEANEPCLGRWVHDDASGLEGLVIEVKTGGWRVVLSFLGDDAPTAAQEARDLAEALRRSREDAAPAPAPAPDPNAFSGHALLQGFMQA